MEHPSIPSFNLSPSSSLMSFNKLMHLLLVPFVLLSEQEQYYTRFWLYKILKVHDNGCHVT